MRELARAGRRTVSYGAPRLEIRPADDANRRPFVRRAVATPDAHRQEYRLENGRRVRLQIRPLETDGELVGAVVILTDDHSHPPRNKHAAEDWAPFRVDAKGTAALIRAARKLVLARTPVLIIGEAGAGKSALAVAIHRNGRQEGGLAVIDCAGGLTSIGFEAEWSLATSAGAQGTLLLERVDELGPEAHAALPRPLDRPSAPLPRGPRPAPPPRAGGAGRVRAVLFGSVLPPIKAGPPRVRWHLSTPVQHPRRAKHQCSHTPALRPVNEAHGGFSMKVWWRSRRRPTPPEPATARS